MADLNIQWGLGARQNNALQGAISGFQAGKAERRQIEIDRALAALGPGLNDPAASSRLYELDPRMAAGVEDAAYQRGERDRAGEVRGAYSDYILAGPGGSPAANGMPMAPDAAPAASLPVSGALAALGGASAPAPAVDPRQAAFERMARADPQAAMQLRETEASEKLKLLETAGKVNEFGVQLLGSVTDQGSYEAAGARYNAMLQQFGFPPANIPAEYSPQTVRRLQLSLLSIKEQIDAAKPITASPGTRLYDPVTFEEVAHNPSSAKFMRVTGADGRDTVIEVGGGDYQPSYAGPAGFVGIDGDQVTSGARSAEHNADVGGVSNSFHLTGQAEDRVPPPGMSMAEYHAQLVQLNPDADVINEGDHVHLEPRGRPGGDGGARTVYRGGRKAAGRAPAGIVRVSSVAEARSLPSGSKFIDPKGIVRVRP